MKYGLFLLIGMQRIRTCVHAVAPPSCTTNEECVVALGQEGAECRINDRTCTGPLRGNRLEEGCFFNHYPEWKKRRVCNSEDAANAAAMGYCREPDFDYPEIRIVADNWESATFNAWILQILLSELLDVPTTVETGLPDVNSNFYNPTNAFDFGEMEIWDAFYKASEVLDCRLANNNQKRRNDTATAFNDNNNTDYEDYQPCAHMKPEMWSTAYDQVLNMTRSEIIELPQPLGVLGRETWYIPRFTAERDASLLSYLGLKGEQNRKKLADTFKRPTTWKTYCEEISTTNCTIEDNVAKRPPLDDYESTRMFVHGLYTGHFRYTDDNNCTLNKKACNGHIADYPCDWISYVNVQTYHHNIALKSSGDSGSVHGYSYENLIEIWLAANATKSDVIMYWWEPETFLSTFAGSDAEFVHVALPPATLKCVRARQLDYMDRCEGDWQNSLGPPEGACDESTNLNKMLSGAFDKIVNDPQIPAVLRSPAYDAAKSFTMTNLQYADILELYSTMEDRPREMLCKWVIDNIDHIQSFVPKSYPRSLKPAQPSQLLFYSSLVAAIISFLVVLSATALLYKRRTERVMVYAQVSFLFLLLGGSFAISLGAIIATLPPTAGSCTTVAWLINFGYTLELVPLIVKGAAINHLGNAAKHYKRATVKRNSLFGAVAFLGTIVIAFLSLWTAMDPPHITSEYSLSDQLAEDGRTTIVTEFHSCGSNSRFWDYICVGWNTLLLLWATVLAFQMRNLRFSFNESQSLAIMIYSHAVFLVFRLATFFLSNGNVNGAILMRIQSLIYSFDTMATVMIYFVPKFTAADDGTSSSQNSRMGTVGNIRNSTRNDHSEFQHTTNVSRYHLNISQVDIQSHFEAVSGRNNTMNEEVCRLCHQTLLNNNSRTKTNASDDNKPNCFNVMNVSNISTASDIVPMSTPSIEEMPHISESVPLSTPSMDEEVPQELSSQ